MYVSEETEAHSVWREVSSQTEKQQKQQGGISQMENRENTYQHASVSVCAHQSVGSTPPC